MTTNLFDTTRNFSLYAIPAAWLLSIAPHFYASSLGGSHFDNRAPRDFVSSLKTSSSSSSSSSSTSTPSLSPETVAEISRAEAAQQNGFENVGLFAAAIVAGNMAGLGARTLNGLAGAWLVSRVVYTGLYVKGTTAALANARSGVFVAGVGIVFTLFIKSGNALRSAVRVNL